MRRWAARPPISSWVIYAAIALVGAVLWWPGLGPPLTDGDAGEYIAIGRTLASHGVYGMTPDAPTMFREPGYPLFLAIFFFIYGSGQAALFVILPIVQLALLVVAARLLEAIVRELWPERGREAVAAGIALVAYPIMIQYAGLLLTEILALALLHAAVLSFLRALKAPEGSKWWWCMAASFSALILVRANWLFLPPLLLAAAFLKGNLSGRRRVLAAVFLLAPVLSGALLIGRNCLTFGRCVPTGRGGIVLYAHAARSVMPAEDQRRYVVSTLAGTFFVSYGHPELHLSGFDGWHASSEEMVSLLATGVSYDRADAMVVEKAKRIMLEHPFSYAGYGLLEVWKIVTPMTFKGPTTSTFAGVQPPAPFWPYAAFLIALRLATLAFLVSLIAGGVRLARASGLGWIVAAIVWYHVFIHVPLDAIPRYFLPAAGLAWIVAVVGAWPIVRRAAAALSRRVRR